MTSPSRTADTSPLRFIDHGDGTVTDARLGLMWSRATLNPRETGHVEAERICAELVLGGYSDWRLPSIEELFGLVDRARSEPAIDTAIFPDTRIDWYWSSTRAAWTPSSLWILFFGTGLSSTTPADDYLGAFVRAVRPLRGANVAADLESAGAG
jgi:hypothetical protein